MTGTDKMRKLALAADADGEGGGKKVKKGKKKG